MTDKIERDKFLTETIGECWHEIGGTVNNIAKCFNCGERIPYCRNAESYYSYSPQKVRDFYSNYQNDFSSWEGFGKLWSWVHMQDWWYEETIFGDLHFDYEKYVNPDLFADAVYNYLKEK